MTNHVRADGIWISKAELALLPTSGAAWDNVKKSAGLSIITINLSDQNNNVDQYILAKALVFARTGEEKYRTDAIVGIIKSIETENGGRTLALGRNLAAVVISADLVGLDEVEKVKFSGWLTAVRKEVLDGRTLITTHNERPNNWGTMCGASRVAAAIYLGDTVDLEAASKVFHGYLGDRTVYAKFKFGDLYWQLNPKLPVGVNPLGATKEYADANGVKALRNIDGFPCDDIRRGENHYWPPKKTGYFYEGLQGCITQAEILHRAGYPVYDWCDKAILREYQAGERLGWQPDGDDTWQRWVVNYRYGTSFKVSTPARGGKIMSYTDWTHGPGRVDIAPTPTP